MIHRKGKNAILRAFFWFKVSDLQLCRSCSVQAKMAACEITLCFVCVVRFSHLPPFPNTLWSPKITCVRQQSRRKDDTEKIINFIWRILNIALFSAAKSLLSSSRVVTASKLWCGGQNVIVLTDPKQKQIILGDKDPEKWGSKAYFPY